MLKRKTLSRASILIGSAVVAMALPGCSLLGPTVPPGRTVREVYEGSGKGDPSSIRISGDPQPGAADRIHPVIYPPKVLAVYVQEHLDWERDIKIGAHWVYMKLRDSSWFPEQIDQEPEASESLETSEVVQLRRVLRKPLEKIIVPYRTDTGGKKEFDVERVGKTILEKVEPR